MSTHDLSLGLAVARVAMTNEIPYEEALDIIGGSFIKPLKSKTGNFVELTLRLPRKEEVDVAAMLMKVKAVCRFTPQTKTVRSLYRIMELLQTSDWTLSFYQGQYSLCYVEESLLLAFSASFTVTLHQRQTKKVLIEIVDLLFSRVEKDGKTLTKHLVGVLGQLVFLFSFDNGCEHQLYALFMSLNGITVPTRPIAKYVLNRVKVISSNEIVMFHLEVIRMYCQKYDEASVKAIRSQIMACLFLFGEQDVLDFGRTLFL